MTAPVDELMQGAVKARQRAQSALTRAVQEAREAEWSWDRIAAALGGSPDAATLQRAFTREPAAQDPAAKPPGCGTGSACFGCRAH